MVTRHTAMETDKAGSGCYCCGHASADDQMVRLSSHDEVVICFRCLDWLNRQRRSKRGELLRAALPAWLQRLAPGYGGHA